MNRLRDLREDHDMKLADVGAIVGLSAMSISRYEREEHALTPELIAKFCEMYGVTADYLLGFTDYPHAAVSDSDTSLLHAYHAAPLEIQKIVNAALEPYRPVVSEKESAAS